MAVYEEKKNGETVLVKGAVSIASRVAKAREEKAKAGLDNTATCVKEVLQPTKAV